jgi:hypothetical protein
VAALQDILLAKTGTAQYAAQRSCEIIYPCLAYSTHAHANTSLPANARLPRPCLKAYLHPAKACGLVIVP